MERGAALQRALRLAQDQLAAQYLSASLGVRRTHGTALTVPPPSAIGLGRSLPPAFSIVALQQCSAPRQQRCGNEPRTACVGLCAEGTKDGVHVDVTFYKPFSKAPLVFTTIQGSADGHQFATVGPQRFVKSTIGTRHPPPAPALLRSAGVAGIQLAVSCRGRATVRGIDSIAQRCAACAAHAM